MTQERVRHQLLMVSPAQPAPGNYNEIICHPQQSENFQQEIIKLLWCVSGACAASSPAFVIGWARSGYEKVFRDHMLQSGQKNGYLNQPFRKKWRFPFAWVLKSRNPNVCCEGKLGWGAINKVLEKNIKAEKKAVLSIYCRMALLALRLGTPRGKRLIHPAQCSHCLIFLPYGMELSTGPTLPKAGGSQRQGQAGKPLSMMSFLRFWIFSLHCRAEKSLVI